MFRLRPILLLTAGFWLFSAPVHIAAAASPSKGLKVDRLIQNAIEETAEALPVAEPEPEPVYGPEPFEGDPAEAVLAKPVISLPAFPSYVETPPEKKHPFKWPEKPGMLVNGMLFLPSLLVREGWDSNVLAAEIDDKSDFVSQIIPQLRIEIPDIRHEVAFEGTWEWRKYLDQISEDQNNFHASRDGHLTAEHGFFVPFTISGSRTHEEREDDLTRQLPDEPFEQAEFIIDSGLQFKRGGFAITLLGHYNQQRFENGVARQGGAPVVREDADRDITGLELHTSFDLNPRNTLMLWGTTGKRDYQHKNFQAGGFNGVERDSDTSSGMMSWIFAYPDLTGHFTLGYESRDYMDDTLEDKRELVGDIEIEHWINDTTSVNFQLARSIFEDEEVIDPVIESRFGFYMDHEFSERLLLAGGTDYKYLDFSNSNRTDETWDFRGLADYIVNDFLAFGAEYIYTVRDSEAAGLDFSRSVIMLRARGRL